MERKQRAKSLADSDGDGVTDDIDFDDDNDGIPDTVENCTLPNYQANYVNSLVTFNGRPTTTKSGSVSVTAAGVSGTTGNLTTLITTGDCGAASPD
nr:hypothetical protein [uncultured Arsenicibacter sp.]